MLCGSTPYKKDQFRLLVSTISGNITVGAGIQNDVKYIFIALYPPAFLGL